LCDALHGIATAVGATFFMVLLAAFAAVLRRFTGQDDLAVGTLSSCRKRPELDAPRDELEQELAVIWERALGVRPIGVDESFFQLGGHSLIAVQVFNEIEAAVHALPGTAHADQCAPPGAGEPLMRTNVRFG
jgi:non-ribosomal peptide synthetase component F